MSLIILASAAHSPGVTSLAVALAVHSQEPALLVDANREPDQSVLAGYLGGAQPRGGLAALLQVHRERRPLATAVEAATVSLGEGADFLPGFTHPGMVSLFASAWPELAEALEAQGRTVIIDAGRVGVDGLPSALVDHSDAVLLVTRSGLPDLAALRLYLPQTLTAAGPDRLGLVLVGPGRPYTGTEIQRQFGVPIWGHLAWQPEAAAVYAEGAAPGRRHIDSGYLRDVRALDRRLYERDHARRALVGVRQ